MRHAFDHVIYYNGSAIPCRNQKWQLAGNSRCVLTAEWNHHLQLACNRHGYLQGQSHIGLMSLTHEVRNIGHVGAGWSKETAHKALMQHVFRYVTSDGVTTADGALCE